MLLRQISEEREEASLSTLATLSRDSRGRLHPEVECDVRTAFQRDRDRVIHSKAFRRLKSKTQVFIDPRGDHYRTRLTHTLEVSQISRTVARALGLNEDLTEAIALAHDLGHTPFGHAGEAVLDQLYTDGFAHNLQSLRVVDFLEQRGKKYRGLNLTEETRDGIRGHTGSHIPFTMEGQVVRICDRVAYLNHDIEDSVRAGVLREDALPKTVLDVLGETRSQRIDRMVKDLVKNSGDRQGVRMSPTVQKASDLLREFLFQQVYIGSAAKQEEGKVYYLLKVFYEYYVEHEDALLERLTSWDHTDSTERRVVDYIAGMTDSYAMTEFQRLFMPKGWARS